MKRNDNVILSHTVNAHHFASCHNVAMCFYKITYSVGCSACDVVMLTSTSCTSGGVLCTTLAHIHKSMESHYTYMRTHNLPVTARCWLTFDVIIGIEGVIY